MFKIFIFAFNVSNQRLRRYTSGVVYADSYGKTVFNFNFNTPDWDIITTKTAVFSCRGKNYSEPLDDNNMCRVPEEVLHEGHFLVSVHGGDIFTNNVRINVMPLSEESEPGGSGGCDCGPNVVYVPEVDEKKILSWKIKEVDGDMPQIPPVDLNPYDEWSGTANEVATDYIWEPMQ